MTLPAENGVFGCPKFLGCRGIFSKIPLAGVWGGAPSFFPAFLLR